jgi:hypothetical protein
MTSDLITLWMAATLALAFGLPIYYGLRRRRG